jgi:hypothetical protein
MEAESKRDLGLREASLHARGAEAAGELTLGIHGRT